MITHLLKPRKTLGNKDVHPNTHLRGINKLEKISYHVWFHL